jgi:ABC-type Fe3+-hydroxamate transport system substrate-binding protein
MRYNSQISSMLFTDQLNNTIELKSYPKRIISLVPSQSELLWDLGIREELVGITKFCIHPDQMFKTVNRIGGTKTVDIEKVRALKPDLIIGNKEENEQSQITQLQKEFTVWVSDIYNLDDSLAMITSVGALVNKVEKAAELTHAIASSFLYVSSKQRSVLYLIWKDPYMAAGKATFIGDMLNRLDLTNSLSDDKTRYPSLSVEDIKTLDPELIFLSSEPYPFKEKHISELQVLLPQTKVMLVDGELFSWYGSRLLNSTSYFKSLLERL